MAKKQKKSGNGVERSGAAPVRGTVKEPGANVPQVRGIVTQRRPKAAPARLRASQLRPARAEAVIRTVPMPSDCNPNGDIFGGWVLSYMDVAGGIVAFRTARGRVVTVGVNAMTFHQPIKVGDVVAIYAWVKKVGRTSVAVDLQTVVTRRLARTAPALEAANEIVVTEGTFTYVAIDDQGRPRPFARQRVVAHIGKPAGAKS